MTSCSRVSPTELDDLHLTLRPRCCVQLAAAILSQLKMPPAEVASTVETFRRNHIQELQVHPLAGKLHLGT